MIFDSVVGYDGLEYTITPIPGEQINLDDYNFEREI